LIPNKNIRADDFTYQLPGDRIAMFPAEIRDQSRLLIRFNDSSLHEDKFSMIAKYLAPGSHLFFNNSRVIPARLVFSKETGSQIEVFCLRPAGQANYASTLSSTGECLWECMIGNLKRFTPEYLGKDIPINGGILHLRAEKLDVSGNIATIKFTWNNREVTFGEILSIAGQTPLPPYIQREPVSSDRERYQTIYSKSEGSVAAPTAGLHFTKSVFRSISDKQISSHSITLHVGAGTFQPVKAERIGDHRMHAEYFEVTTDLVQLLANLGKKVSSVGTTTVRTLESLYWLGVKLIVLRHELPNSLELEQWEPYGLPQDYSMEQAFEALVQWFSRHNSTFTMASTKLMIIPGYKFRVTDTLITNFHQPGSTLLLLIAAFIGDSWRETYNYALDNGFRFLSYGDSSLLFNCDS